MMKPTPIGAGRGGLIYFLSQDAELTGDAYHFGHGAWELGLSKFDREAFTNLYDCRGLDGEVLGQSSKKEADHGSDLTFSAPKSVSTAWGIGAYFEKAAIERCHREAVNETLHEIEKELRTRAGKGGKNQEQCGAVFSVFEHKTARQVEGFMPDPNLHSHCVMHARAITLSDGKWRSFRSEPVYKKQMHWGKTYREKLAHKLQLAGYKVKWQDDTFHLGNIPKKLEEALSKRSQQIDMATNFSEIGAERARAAKMTRGEKKGFTEEALTREWLRQADMIYRLEQMKEADEQKQVVEKRPVEEKKVVERFVEVQREEQEQKKRRPVLSR